MVVLPLITTESWVRFPGLIFRDRNICRFHHNCYPLADNPITSLVCNLCDIYLCASPPVISYEEIPQYIRIQRVTIVLAEKSDMRGSTSFSPEIEYAQSHWGWGAQELTVWVELPVTPRRQYMIEVSLNFIIEGSWPAHLGFPSENDGDPLDPYVLGHLLIGNGRWGRTEINAA